MITFTFNSNFLFAFLAFLVVGCIAKPKFPSGNENDEMVDFMGKSFYKNGQRVLPAQSTPPQFFDQCMDHFNASGCNQKWTQRFWVREEFFQPGGPIFFMFGGEWDSSGDIDTFAFDIYAEHYNAMMIVLEHRFYGRSWPTEEETVEAFQLLTSQQALADAAYFIDDFKTNRNLTDNDWVAFGCSYPGNLAAWFKQKYPTYVKTAVSSSGPLLATYDFPGYLEVVSDVVLGTDTSCYEKVYDAFSCMESLLNGTTCRNYTSIDDIMPALHQCNDIDLRNKTEREMWFSIVGMGQWGSNNPTWNVDINCGRLARFEGDDPLDVYGRYLGNNCKKSGDSDPIRTFLRKQGTKSAPFMWYWQTCYEFGYYFSSDPVHGLFGHDTFSGMPYGKICDEYNKYGGDFTREYVEERIRLTNEYYKGKEIDTKCVIFVNGEWDPWHRQGIRDASETSVNNTVIYIPKAEHCMDYYHNASPDVKLAQEKIKEQIGIYLNDPNCL